VTWLALWLAVQTAGGSLRQGRAAGYPGVWVPPTS